MAQPAARPVITPDPFATALLHGAAPGEVEGLNDSHVAAMAALAADVAAARVAGEPTIRLERHGEGAGGTRRMALVIVNDDMPFLVDSVSMAIAAAGLESKRLLHPVVDVRRDADGALVELVGSAIGPMPPAGATRESLIYAEIERAAGGVRQRLVEELKLVLADVRACVEDWQPMLDAVRASIKRLRDQPPPISPHLLAENSAFLEWLGHDNFLLLGTRGYTIENGSAGPRLVAEAGGLGVLRDRAKRLWNGVDEEDLPEPLDRFLARPDPLLVTKSDRVSTVHRRASCDYVSVKRHDAAGMTVGEDRFIGLFTSDALHASPRVVPLLRRRVGQVIAELGFDPRGHNGKALIHVLESFPREELFQVSPERLREMTLGLLSLLDRPRPKLFIRTDPFGRQVSALVYVPREAYSTEVRIHVGQMLESAVGAGLDHYNVELRSEGLARIHFVFGLEGGHTPEFDEAALNRRLVELVRGWDEALEAELSARVGPTRAARIALTQSRVFSTSYRAQFSAGEAADDVLRLSNLDGPGEHAVHLYRRTEDPPRQLRLKIYHLDEIISLSDAVPVLERFGFRVIEEYPFDVDTGRRGYVHDFLIEIADADLCDVAALDRRISPALTAVLDGEQENDVFNALVIAAELDSRSVGWLRAYYRYLRQTGFTYAQATMVDALTKHGALTRDLASLFCARFDPAHAGEPAATIRARLADALSAIASIDEDRVIRMMLAAIEATVRTNAFAPAAAQALAFKLDSARLPGLPALVPYREIWVYSPRVEGIHLRGGPIARGGLRWSDRREDFRTEILGLLKAQIVKNAVIVPTGAKGGFYPKQLCDPAASREEWLAEGTECYRIFIRSLLSVTDNIVDGAVVPPRDVVRHDDDDPYLVVAADKGTAAFSDIANGLAIEHGFWLGDAFASGGSVGYDHKAMGITAKGAWISVERHFAERGHDVATQPTTTVGVGDMSGDVFGNGMLLSKALKLVAAFDHRHIFLDPNPDPAASHAERARLFALPRSSWADYDPARLSAGGAVVARTQKMIPLSAEARTVLGVEAEQLAPAELIRVILRAPVDLLWFGGIGTYVKADYESHDAVGDRANDANRVNADEVRAAVIAEGANLAITQGGRTAFARAGGSINTDFIDNSAGVDTSDHEVNIKIALQPAVLAAKLAAADRDALLESMTDEVAALVLDDNTKQTRALTIAERRGCAAVPAFVGVIQSLAADGRLDRAVEGLPSDDLLAQRAQGGHGLVRPELAVILAHAKLAIQDAFVACPLVDDPLLVRDLVEGFPPQLSERFPDALAQHRLRREIVATTLANELVNRGGITLPFELAEELGATLAQVGTAFVAVRELFGLVGLWRAIDAIPTGELHYDLHAHAITGLRAQMADVLRTFPASATSSQIVESTRAGVRRVDECLDEILRAEPQAELQRMRETLDKRGGPEPISRAIVRLHALDGAVAVAALAREIGAPELGIAQAYTEIGDRLGLDWAKARANALAPSDPWERLLVATAERDLEQLRFDLIRRIAANGAEPVDAARRWLAGHPEHVARVTTTIARARQGAATTSAMLAHIAAQARAALAA